MQGEESPSDRTWGLGEPIVRYPAVHWSGRPWAVHGMGRGQATAMPWPGRSPRESGGRTLVWLNRAGIMALLKSKGRCAPATNALPFWRLRTKREPVLLHATAVLVQYSTRYRYRGRILLRTGALYPVLVRDGERFCTSTSVKYAVAEHFRSPFVLSRYFDS